MISFRPAARLRAPDHMYLLQKPGGFLRDSYRIDLRKYASKEVCLIAV